MQPCVIWGSINFDAPYDRPYYERLACWPTLTINGLHGGYGGPRSKTVLPHEAFAKCDIRLVEAQSAEEIFAKVEAHAGQHAPEVEFIRREGWNLPKPRLIHPMWINSGGSSYCHGSRTTAGSDHGR